MARSRENRHVERKKKGDDDGGCCFAIQDTYMLCCGRFIPALLLSVLTARLRSGPRPRAHDPAAPRPTGRAAAALYGAVRHYRQDVSPTRPACCPYTPSCSTYAVKALHRHGAARGLRLITARLWRCRPAAARRRGGYDPVPD
ncbi:membrane protein insertion efficiency factor YidD [Streptomyces yaizuensis]|uniref:Putative membrane protein insertion efficiency factor n=1 Tax=Streptomyces yaizuensis TaxID=2989713 RepID=A0ABQ5P987_9ACTN|nr:membrane protein insertion efficiency factor YidD [Streptomyces sp. YSPA8]GLF99131.1 membrane protein insertion efficiency factor YidD [Streptomyces sp. YSPA8]